MASMGIGYGEYPIAPLCATVVLSMAEHGQKTITICKTITDGTPLMVVILCLTAFN